MAQADFAYEPANDAAGLPLMVSIFADRAHLREDMRGDAAAAGFRIGQCGGVRDLLEGEARPLGEVVLLDCPRVDAGVLAALSRLDIRAARSGAQLVVSTSVEALDDVFGCLDQSQPQLLVDPGRAERVISLGRVLARAPNLRLRELSEEDRLALLRLTEQVAQIAERLEKLGAGAQADTPRGMWGDGVYRVESPAPGYSGEDGDRPERLTPDAQPSLPDPRLVRRIIRQRHLRARFFDGDLFADPAWDMLLDLTAARAEGVRVSVTSLCIASGVPPTTALRWISQMTQAGLLERAEDETDRRRAFIALTDKAAEAMARYFAELDKAAGQPV
jgi:hypothetical protein